MLLQLSPGTTDPDLTLNLLQVLDLPLNLTAGTTDPDLPLNLLIVPSGLLQRGPDELIDFLLGTSTAARASVLAPGMVDVAQVVERSTLQHLWPPEYGSV